MKTVRALLAVTAAVAVIVFSSTAAMAVTFDLDISVGWQIAGATCNGGPNDCLGFDGFTGPAGTATRLNWDNATTTPDSFLSIGALPDSGGFQTPPIGTRTGTIADDGVVVRSAQIRHENNVISDADNDLATIQLRTTLTLRDGANIILATPLDPFVTFLETTNTAPCDQTSNSQGSTCDDQYTLDILISADIPFSYLGEDYILHVTGLHNPDGSLACEPGPPGTAIACLTEEGIFNDRFVHLSLENVTQDVPAPASLLLVGLGLVGAGVLPILRKRLSA